MKNKDRNKLEPLLRAFKTGNVDFEYAIKFILDVYSSSRRFNWNSFSLGLSIGITIALIVIYNLS